MRRLILLIFLLINICTANAEIIRTSPYNMYRPTNRNYTVHNNYRYNNPQRLMRTNRYRQRQYYNHCPQCHHNNYFRPPIKINNIKKLEKYAMNRTFSNEDDITRLERLEELAFGAIQNGDISTRYNNVENAILARPPYKTKTSVLGTIGSFLAGQATGITPNITSQELNGFNNFSTFGGNYFSPVIRPYPSYSNNMVEQYSNGIFSGGWTNLGSDYGTGSSVRILE